MTLVAIVQFIAVASCTKTGDSLPVDDAESKGTPPTPSAWAAKPPPAFEASGSGSPPGDDKAEVNPYPRGRWRLGTAEGLDGVLLWASHILIRHQETRGTNACFGPPGWNVYPPPPQRTRIQALALANELAAVLEAAPHRFNDIAAEWSEDVPTRASSGSLGGVNAVDFLSTPPILDALASLAPTEISRVIETRCGFHVLRRDPPSTDEVVSGVHIVIGHRNARWLHRFGTDSPVPDRSREDAFELANRVFLLVSKDPSKAEEYVRQYSEHRDAGRNGDLGEWSTRQVPRMARQVDVLTKLAIDGVAPPLETIFGFEVIIRRATTPRTRYAMEAIQVTFDGEVRKGSPNSKSAALNVALDIASTLARDHSQWSSLQQAHCCPGIEVWSQGSSSAELENELDRLEPGEISRRPIQAHSAFVVARRIPSSQIPPPSRVRLELPAPDAPHIPALIARFTASTVQRTMQDVSARASALLNLPEHEATSFNAMHDLGPSFLILSARERLNSFVSARKRIEESLSSAQAKTYERLMNQTFEALVLSTAATGNAPEPR